NNEVRAITIDVDGLVYVGGNFDAAGGNTAPRIAVWDGTNWGTLGSGTSGFVQAMAITQDYIYAGGNFAVAGNNTVNRIARWDRASLRWDALGQGLSGNVNAMVVDGGYLYAGGNFETASDEQDINKIVNNIARWSENNGWEAMGNGTEVGVDNIVNSLTLDLLKSRLYVGGTFSLAGDSNASNIAIWSETLILPPTNPEDTELLYPNPFEHLINVEVKNSSQFTINASLFTISGIFVSSKSYSIQNDMVTLEFPILSSGLYYLKLQNEDTDKAYKIIKR
ncbi:glucose dehydrogenase, partial [Arenibacter sp. N53]|uniref:T9SS type A sorting domain-containing protein n=1 Tax=Arenibacter TaxID=178469 RepID=UPI0012FFD635